MTGIIIIIFSIVQSRTDIVNQKPREKVSANKAIIYDYIVGVRVILWAGGLEEKRCVCME